MKRMSPQPGDYVRLDSEHHTTVSKTVRHYTADWGHSWLIEDIGGGWFWVERSEDDDNLLRRGWRNRAACWTH